MIVSKMIGGLGNQLFQYAIGRHLAIRNSTEFKIDVTGFRYYKLHKYSLQHFNLAAAIASDDEIDAFRAEQDISLKTKALILVSRLYRGTLGREQGSPPLAWKRRDGVPRRYVVEGVHRFQPHILELPDHSYLDGFWQNELYFKAIESTIRQELTFKTPPTPANAEMAQQVRGNDSVSVHVRRADYLTNATTLAIHGVCGKVYYQRCAAIIRQRVPGARFFVFSDDTSWARANLDLGGPTTVVDLNNADFNYEDIRLMSLCRHHVTANSSFSWWGAWLDPRPDKIVLCPERWFTGAQYDGSEVVPPGWERVSNAE